MLSRLRGSNRRRLLINTLSLYAVQGSTYLLPLLTIPYLSRVLGPKAWGSVLFAQAIGALIAMLVEYGFDLSATREAARNSHDTAGLSELLTGVLLSKVVLAAFGITAALLLRPITTHVASSPALFWSSVGWGVGQGINMFWYFQGLQRMALASGLDIAGRIVATGSIFVLVHRPEDGWKVMLAQALGCAVSHAATVAIAAREVGFSWPGFGIVWQTLRRGWDTFLFRSSLTLVNSASTAVLGFASSATAVGLFGTADKFRQAAAQLFWPINQALFPHLSEVIKTDPSRGMPIARRSLVVLGGMAAACGLVLGITAPFVIRIVLGPRYEGAVPVLRVLAVFIPLQVLCTVLSAQLLLPLGMDRQVSSTVLRAGAFSTVLGFLLSLAMGATGMAIALTVAQVYSVFSLERALRKRGLSPLMPGAAGIAATVVS